MCVDQATDLEDLAENLLAAFEAFDYALQVSYDERDRAAIYKERHRSGSTRVVPARLPCVLSDTGGLLPLGCFRNR